MQILLSEKRSSRASRPVVDGWHRGQTSRLPKLKLLLSVLPRDIPLTNVASASMLTKTPLSQSCVMLDAVTYCRFGRLPLV